MDRAKKLIEQLLAHPNSSESAAYELLTEYQRGSPIESLRVLLSSQDDRLAGEGTWIASELPEAGNVLLRDLRRLLVHRSKEVRFWAIECVLLWAGPADGHELASAIALVDDSESAVRWRAMGFLSMASREQLDAALIHVKATNIESPYLNELDWLLSPDGSDSAQIIGGLRDLDPRHRKFAAAAAFRIAKNHSEPLRYGASIDDPEVAQFAGDMLKRISSS
jgi:hypothetical protein